MRVPYHAVTATTPLVANQYRYADNDGTVDFYPMKIETIEALADAGTTYQTLRFMPYWKYQKYMEGQYTTTTVLTTGTPTYWTWHAGYIYLYPCPSYAEDAGLRITARSRDILDEDTDTTHLPAAYEYLVITYCLAKAYKKDDQVEKGRFYDDEFDRGVDQFQAYLQGSRSMDPIRLPTVEERRIRLG